MTDATKDRPGVGTEAAETSLAGDTPTVPGGSVGALLAPLVGTEIPGGCDECPDPHQTVERHPTGAWLLTVHHHDSCPRLARYRRGGVL